MAYGLVLAAGCVAFRARIPGWAFYAAAHAAVVLLSAYLVRAGSRGGRLLRDFDMAVTIPVYFLMVCQLVHRIHPVDYDARLIEIDRSIGGIDVMRWMKSIETPLLTQLTKWAWISYYFIPFIPGLVLYARADRARFHEAKLLFILGWLVSYLGYFAVPAEGPAYHEGATGVPQPVWAGHSSALKDVIHALEGEARDTFPSGHAIVAAITIAVCFRNRLWKASAAAVPLSLGVIWSTIYLRYHYLIDVLAGLALAALCVGAGIAWFRHYSSKSNRLQVPGFEAVS
jgi:membrane-associated phospholipid phosphatase